MATVERCPAGQHDVPEGEPGRVTHCRRCRASVRVPKGAVRGATAARATPARTPSKPALENPWWPCPECGTEWKFESGELHYCSECKETLWQCERCSSRYVLPATARSKRPKCQACGWKDSFTLGEMRIAAGLDPEAAPVTYPPLRVVPEPISKPRQVKAIRSAVDHKFNCRNGNHAYCPVPGSDGYKKCVHCPETYQAYPPRAEEGGIDA